MKLFVRMSFLLLLCGTSAYAHGDLDLRIKAMTTIIEAHPDSAALYFTRGKLRFQHEEYQASIEDINYSISKGFEDELQKIYLAKALFKLGNFEEAQLNLNQYLEENPDNVVGLNLKARILYAQHKYEASALCFERVILLSIKSLPENYLEAAQSWSESLLPDKYNKTVNILELGIKKLGPIVTLQNKLIETHLEAKNREQALEIQFSIIENSKRKESNYFKLAEIYLHLEEFDNSKKAAINAKTHWDNLPSRIQNNAAMKALKNEIQHLLSKLQQLG